MRAARALALCLLALMTACATSVGSHAVATAAASPKAGAPAGETLGRCKNCVYILERIKQGYHYLLPNICEEILKKTSSSDEYATCHKMLAGLSKWGLHVRQWMHQGCYRSEPYGAFSLVQPCPSHVICSKITDLENSPFCSEVLTDFAPDGAAGAAGKASATPKARTRF